ncbi:MAG TPA: NADP-dependent oxidoreductase [Homoserinimonas sp.]|nr:NADP-dependent oxidoreductase [Homoserinimonas sp.]
MQPELPATMWAAVIDHTGEPGVLHLAEVPAPRNISGELLVKVSAAGINPIDAKTRSGGGVSSAITQYPAILGGDFSGVVVETSYTAHPLQPGDLVYGMMSVPRTQGSYAEYVAVSSLSVARRPKNLTDIEAAGVPLAALTAWGALEQAELAPGKRVLIHAGAGGVGHFAVQFAAHLGAEVVATASGRNVEWLRALGASEVIDYKAARFEDHLTGLDAVIDLIGNVQDNTGTRSLQTMRPGGIIVNVPSGSWPTFLDDAHDAGMLATTYKVNPDARVLEQITRLIEAGKVSVNIDKVYPLAEAAAAHAELEGGHTRGKIVLDVNAE